MNTRFNLILLFIFTIATKIVYSQNNFTKGYHVGFQKGYCYSQGYGCMPPISPTPPIPNLGENYSNYNDGYNRGFIDGLNANKIKNKRYSSSQSEYQSLKPEFPQLNLYSPDNDFLNNVYQSAQDRYNKNQINSRTSPQYFENNKPGSQKIDPDVLKKHQEYIKINNVKNRKLRIESLYSKYKSYQRYPSKILNGVYKGKLICKETEHYEFYETCDVWVVNNTIVALEYVSFYELQNSMIMAGFFPLDFYFPSFQERIIFGEISSGKSAIITNTYNPALKETTIAKHDVILLDYVSDFNKFPQIIQKIRSIPANYQLSNATGWHKGYLSDRNILCEERDFYLENGKVKKWIGKTGLENIVDSGGLLMEGRTSVSVVRPPIYQNLSNSPFGKSMVELYDIYFIR